MQKKKIMHDERGQVLNWYGFWTSDEVEKEGSYIKISGEEAGVAELYVKGKLIGQINFWNFLQENADANTVVPIHKENEIWNFIFKEARKFKEVKNKKIFIERADVEYGGLAYSLSEVNIPEAEAVVERYFQEKLNML